MFNKKNFLLVGCLSLSMLAETSYASAPIPDGSYEAVVPPIETSNKFVHPFYIGVTGGYGSTTWRGLVPPKDKRGSAILLSTPIDVDEGGAVWGAYAGYEVIPCFAVEASYMRYPTATVFFDSSSLFTFLHNGLTQFDTRTENVALMAKFMLFIPGTDIRAYSSAGISALHRWDMLQDAWRPTPTFGVGFTYNFTDRIMGEIGFNYTGGFGLSELDPTQDYMPFLYSGFVRLAYRFG